MGSRGAGRVQSASLHSLGATPSALSHRTMLTLACSSKTATLSTVRYVSPRGMPLFSFAIPVRTVLHFGGPSKSLQVTHIAEEWPLDAFLQRTPVVGTL